MLHFYMLFYLCCGIMLQLYLIWFFKFCWSLTKHFDFALYIYFLGLIWLNDCSIPQIEMRRATFGNHRDIFHIIRILGKYIGQKSYEVLLLLCNMMQEFYRDATLNSFKLSPWWFIQRLHPIPIYLRKRDAERLVFESTFQTFYSYILFSATKNRA